VEKTHDVTIDYASQQQQRPYLCFFDSVRWIHLAFVKMPAGPAYEKASSPTLVFRKYPCFWCFVTVDSLTRLQEGQWSSKTNLLFLMFQENCQVLNECCCCYHYRYYFWFLFNFPIFHNLFHIMSDPQMRIFGIFWSRFVFEDQCPSCDLVNKSTVTKHQKQGYFVDHKWIQII